jgi:signal transduction histidine kinase
MNEQGDSVKITKLEARLKAQQKIIEVLMDAAEQRHTNELSSTELLSQNLNLERVVQQKTGFLQKQGEDLKKALRDLQLTQARLLQAQKLESVGQLAAGIAHEINTPAQFISSNISFLGDTFVDVKRLIDTLQEILRAMSEKSTSMETARKTENLLEEIGWSYLEKEIPLAIQQSKEGINRITTIVQAMKEFSHPGNKEKSFQDLNKILEITMTVARNEWKYCSELVTHFDPNLPRIFCLGDEIGQVFLNLLINATHAIVDKNKGNAQKGTITISTRQYPEYVEVSIEDTGNGIPENIRDKVFDPFFTTKSVGKGTGQGLAISHDVIENKHNGTLTFTSEIGKGSIFRIQLPIEEI